MKILMNDVHWDRAASVQPEVMHRVTVSSSCSSHKKEAVSSVKKTSAILKKAVTDRHVRWPKKEWYSKTKPHWRQSSGEEVGQISHDEWKSSKPQGKWKEICGNGCMEDRCERENEYLEQKLQRKRQESVGIIQDG